MTKEYVLVTVSGPDRPGITASLVGQIAKGPHRIIDMGQSVMHGFLSLSILLDFKNFAGEDDDSVLKDLLFEAKKLGLALDFKIVEERHFGEELKEKHILCCVSSENLPPSFVRDVSRLFATHGINILRIDNISGQEFKCLEITALVPPGLPLSNVKMDLLKIGQTYSIDLAFLKDTVFRRNKRLVVMDMDSTLIQAEVIDELAKAHGVEDEVKLITEKAMNGELDFNHALLERVKKLKGLPEEKMRLILERLPLTPGAEEFIKTTKELGYKIALISGGFNYFTNALKEKFGLDYAFSNELEIINGVVTGNVRGTIINADQKAILLELIAQQEKIGTDQVVAIGDGANDLPMLAKAGLGIAFHAKEIVKKKADNHLSYGPMTTVLYFLGIPGPIPATGK